MEAKDFMPGDAAIAGIRAEIERYEAERRRARLAAMWRVPLFDGLTLVAVFVIAWLFNKVADPNEQWLSTPHVLLYVFGFFFLFFVHSRAVRPLRTMQQMPRDKILPLVFGFIDDVDYRRRVKPASFDRLPRETVGPFERESFEDVVSGRYEGFPFELYEAALGSRDGSPVFNGVIVSFEMITPFPGVVIAAQRENRAAGFLKGFFGGRLETLQSGVAELDEIYEFHTDNVEAARPLVAGRLAKALQWLGQTWPEQPARIALKGKEGFLLIPLSKNFFELPGDGKALDYKAHVEPMIADMVSLLATAALVRKVGQAEE